MAKPLKLRQLKAEMVMKELDLRAVARAAGVPYCTASEILNGRRLDARRLGKLSTEIKRHPVPEETAQ